MTNHKCLTPLIIEAFEVANLYEVAKATMISAAARHENRGAHSVADYDRPEDDDYAPKR